MTSETLQKEAKKKRKWRYKIPDDLKPEQENVFLNMYLRKTNRAMSGTKSRNTTYELGFLAVVLVLSYGFGSQTREDEVDKMDTPYFVALSFGQVVVIGVWLFLAAVVTAVFKESRFIELLYWMFVYLPLLAIVLSFMFASKLSLEGDLGILNQGEAIGILLLIAELLAMAVFFSQYFVYPKIINSNWFHHNSRAAKLFRVHVVGEFTMTYRGIKNICGKRNTCKYEGEKNEKGEPHGLGRWFDDAFDGEVLVGTWRNGVPTAPFISRHYGRGDVFSAVRIAFVQATDDEFTKTKFWPTNENPAKCGIAAVECSVSGSFYNELPQAEIIIGPELFNTETSVKELCDNLRHAGTNNAEPNILQITANDPRGVQVQGHVHATTGRHLENVDELLIKIHRGKRRPSLLDRPSFMPKSISGLLTPEMIHVREDQEENKVTNVDVTIMSENDPKHDGNAVEDGLTARLAPLSLSIDGWMPAKSKDALIFFGGFNCSLEGVCHNFGQFLAMTKLDAHIYPIIYNWPCGQVLTYHSASRTSHRPKNRENVLHLLQGLQNAGIRNVHLMSHSMGAQTLIGSFCDLSDGSRSEISRCFHLAPDFEETRSKDDDDDDDDNLLICKTMTMLNPDFPVVPFVNHAFRSVRRICSTITVVGDRNDGALYFSQAVNGVGVYFGYEQPEPMLPNNANKEHLRYLYTVGRNIDDLYFTKDQEKVHSGHGSKHSHDPFVFEDVAPLALVSEQEEDEDKAWLDLDVIDTTGLDTNIANIRHSAFSLNPNLLNDLEELITTGNRAMKRSSLLYRDGNLFSYCHVPSYVSF